MRRNSRIGAHRRLGVVAAGVLACALALAACSSSGGGSGGDDVGVSLILKTLSNPYFVSMEKTPRPRPRSST
jgi:fructose transport system substrate-binding protein